MPVAHPCSYPVLPVLITKNVFGHCQISPGGQNCSQLRTIGLNEVNTRKIAVCEHDTYPQFLLLLLDLFEDFWFYAKSAGEFMYEHVRAAWHFRLVLSGNMGKT